MRYCPLLQETLFRNWFRERYPPSCTASHFLNCPFWIRNVSLSPLDYCLWQGGILFAPAPGLTLVKHIWILAGVRHNVGFHYGDVHNKKSYWPFLGLQGSKMANIKNSLLLRTRGVTSIIGPLLTDTNLTTIYARGKKSATRTNCRVQSTMYFFTSGKFTCTTAASP